MPGPTSKGVATAEDIKSIPAGSFLESEQRKDIGSSANARYLTGLVPLLLLPDATAVEVCSFNVTPRPRCLVQYVCRVLLVCLLWLCAY